MLFVSAFLVGLVAGLRSLLAPAVVSWAARTAVLPVAATPLAFMGYRYTPIVFTVFALGELIADKLPSTPSRTMPPSFVFRVLSGGLVGATVGAAGGMLTVGLILGALGAVVGTLGGAAVRGRLAAAFGRDLPAALVEDLAGIAIAIFAVMRAA